MLLSALAGFVLPVLVFLIFCLPITMDAAYVLHTMGITILPFMAILVIGALLTFTAYKRIGILLEIQYYGNWLLCLASNVIGVLVLTAFLVFLCMEDKLVRNLTTGYAIAVLFVVILFIVYLIKKARKTT